MALGTAADTVIELEQGSGHESGVNYNSVIHADQRLWGVPNVHVCDGSVCHPHRSANPGLTIAAFASRLGAQVAPTDPP